MLLSFGLFSTKNDIIQRLIYTILNTTTLLFICMNRTFFITLPNFRFSFDVYCCPTQPAWGALEVWVVSYKLCNTAFSQLYLTALCLD